MWHFLHTPGSEGPHQREGPGFILIRGADWPEMSLYQDSPEKQNQLAVSNPHHWVSVELQEGQGLPLSRGWKVAESPGSHSCAPLKETCYISSGRGQSRQIVEAMPTSLPLLSCFPLMSSLQLFITGLRGAWLSLVQQYEWQIITVVIWVQGN